VVQDKEVDLRNALKYTQFDVCHCCSRCAFGNLHFVCLVVRYDCALCIHCKICMPAVLPVVLECVVENT
jgi:hypothetical protein